MTESKAVQKLRVLLPHWIQHNDDHAAEFRVWARRAGQAGGHIEAAAQHYEEANFMLKEALEQLGGPLDIEAEHEHSITRRG